MCFVLLLFSSTSPTHTDIGHILTAMDIKFTCLSLSAGTMPSTVILISSVTHTSFALWDSSSGGKQ